jgi:DNA-directed RNA polymerase specialized sigma24 family protein
VTCLSSEDLPNGTDADLLEMWLDESHPLRDEACRILHDRHTADMQKAALRIARGHSVVAEEAVDQAWQELVDHGRDRVRESLTKHHGKLGALCIRIVTRKALTLIKTASRMRKSPEESRMAPVTSAGNPASQYASDLDAKSGVGRRQLIHKCYERALKALPENIRHNLGPDPSSENPPKDVTRSAHRHARRKLQKELAKFLQEHGLDDHGVYPKGKS